MTYDEYLNLDTLLSLQEPHTNEHTELMFIVAHQSSELWFKVLIHELNSDIVNLKRLVRIFNHLNTLWDIIATMSYEDYEKFRNTLGTASGKQSEQYVKVERLLKALQEKLTWKWSDQSRIEEEELLDVENAFKKWQFSHMKTVERIIGNRPGTGGTSGVDYLKRAVDKPLWNEE